MAERCGSVRALTSPQLDIVDVPPDDRKKLEPILEEGFEGLYLRHSKRTLDQIGVVRAALEGGEPVGLIMLKTIEERVGYVYYVAVTKARRRGGVGARLLEDALGRFMAAGVEDVYASVEEDNLPSWKLFEAHGFARTSIGEVAKRFGTFRALNMYRMMMVVPGEALLHKALAPSST